MLQSTIDNFHSHWIRRVFGSSCGHRFKGLAEFLFLLLCLLRLPGPVTRVTAQDSLAFPTAIRIEQQSGPPKTIALVIRYYLNRQLIESKIHHVDLDLTETTVQTEAGYAGMRITLFNSSDSPLTVKFFEGTKQLETNEINRRGVAELSYGDISAQDLGFKSPRFLPDQSDHALIQNFVATLAGKNTQVVVASPARSSMDQPSFDAICKALRREFGDLPSENIISDGWIRWDDVDGQTVFSGYARFAQQTCKLEFSAAENNIVSLRVDAASFPDDWFQGVATTAIYEEKALRLVEHLIAGDAINARNDFDPEYQPDVSLESMVELAGSIREQLGRRLLSSELKSISYGTYDDQANQKSLFCTHALKLEGGKTCLSRTQFVFRCDRHSVERGRLAQINVHEAWSSAAPQQIDITRKALAAIFANRNAPGDGLNELMHPDVLELVSPTELAGACSQMSTKLGTIASYPDWDLWKVSTLGSYSRASGQLEMQSGAVDVVVDFVDHSLVGLTAYGPAFAASTLSSTVPVQSATEMARGFWSALLSGQLNNAHAMLAEEFQQQLPLSDFNRLVEESGILDLGDLESIEVDPARICSRPNRSQPAILTVHGAAIFPDVVQPFLCDFVLLPNRDVALVNFNTDFEERIPLPPDVELRRVLGAFRSGAAEQVAQLADPQERSEVDMIVLQNFLSALQPLLDNSTKPAEAGYVHSYSLGKRREFLQGVVTSAEEEIPFEFTLELGRLKSFHFHAPKLANFIDENSDFSSARQLAENFLDNWLDESVPTELTSLLADELRDQVTLLRLAEIRNRLNAAPGTSQQIEFSAPILLPKENTIRYECRVPNGGGEFSKLALEIAFDALSCRVSAVQLIDVDDSTN
ncbi:MAG: hypothetical protein KDB22_23030 [Planctomycetales bacterium]|nr:hypothetical protein [Planctomycetales bacterium]